MKKRNLLIALAIIAQVGVGAFVANSVVAASTTTTVRGTTTLADGTVRGTTPASSISAPTP